MTWRVEVLPEANRNFETHKKAGNKILLAKIGRLLEELEHNPYEGTGKPHRLKHFKGQNVWSRHIDDRHRLVYSVHDNVVTVFVISLWGHYGDE